VVENVTHSDCKLKNPSQVLLPKERETCKIFPSVLYLLQANFEQRMKNTLEEFLRGICLR
jgi:hypothetical protein